MNRKRCGSVVNGTVAKGCEYCMNGSKMVLFITGKCSTGCFYCPVSDEKKGYDVIYANEKKITSSDDVSMINEIIHEAEMMDAEGTGITGGDPLMNIDRTVNVIKKLKERFGKEHHIHLYTSSINHERTMMLEAAGLDEIRFHPSVDKWNDIRNTELGKIISSVTKMIVGIEVPSIPDMSKELEELISDVLEMNIDFVNINELEFSESNWEMMSARRYGLKDEISSAVLDSDRTIKRILKKFQNANLHYCSSAFKDSVQLRERLIRTAKKNAADYDIITDDGTIMKGIVYADDLIAAFNFLRDEYEIPNELIRIDNERKRIDLAPWILEEIANELPYKCYITEEYPTADRLEVERMPL